MSPYLTTELCTYFHVDISAGKILTYRYIRKIYSYLILEKPIVLVIFKIFPLCIYPSFSKILCEILFVYRHQRSHCSLLNIVYSLKISPSTKRDKSQKLNKTKKYWNNNPYNFWNINESFQNYRI